ncbi:MAG: AMP-dependent synthetase/ligase, partial [Planctomycetota bacterium]
LDPRRRARHDHQRIKAGDPVVQWSENCYEWILADLAIQSLQAVHVPIHATLTASQAAAQVAHCGASFGLVDDSAKVDALINHQQLPDRTLKTLCYKKPTDEQKPATSHFIADRVKAVTPEQGQSILAELESEADPQDIATILYTSGTTGAPKGIALTHANLVSNAKGVVTTFGEQESDVRLCILPLSHIFARTCDMYGWIAAGSLLALSRSRETVIEDCRIVRPTLMNGVPYFYQRVCRRLGEMGLLDEPGGLKTVLGGEIRACASGGAALDAETYQLFFDRGVPILQGYGLSESSPVIAMSTLSATKMGYVGRALPNVEIKIAEDGEIMARGPNIMHGYWADEEATAAVIDEEGWLKTGDIGELDDEGYLKITGRKKEIIVTATGKNIAPTQLENLLCRHPLIDQAMVIGDDKSYLVALLVPDETALTSLIQEQRIWVWSRKSVRRNKRVRSAFADAVTESLKRLSRHEQVRDFVLLDRPFSIELGEMTAKLSLCRPVIYKTFQRQIEALYAKSKKR